jgi:DNA-binding NtrC family response regulator
MKDSSAKSYPQVAEYVRLRVSVTDGPDAGTSAELSHLPLRVGASSESDLVLSDVGVAGRHCTLESVARGVRIRDEGSPDGVFLGDARVFDAIASLPARIALGESRLLVERLPEPLVRKRVSGEGFGDLLGRSTRMRELFAELASIAELDGSVLIRAERGTGRQLVAESLHDASTRRNGPFIFVDCSDLSHPPTQKSLFGNERGASAGPGEAHAGAFEQAHAGALYLHEVGSLPKALQLGVERVLETGEVPRVGASQGTRVDVRLLSSSSTNLVEEAKRGRFELGLFERLARHEVRIPALCDRMEDLPLLVEHVLYRTSRADSVREVPASLLSLLAAYDWPGNVRELFAVVRMLMMERAPSSASNPARLPPTEAPPVLDPTVLEPLRIARRAASDRFEQAYVGALLARTQGNVTRAAAIAEVSRQMMQKLLRKHRQG